MRQQQHNCIRIPTETYTYDENSTHHQHDQHHHPHQHPHGQHIALPPSMSPSVSALNWVSCLPCSRRVTSLSIPGTHDSAAYQSPLWYHSMFTSPIWKTQDHNIQQQLHLGIRFFDVRLKCHPGEKLTLFHGDVYLGQFGNVMNPIYQFIKQNKREFVIMLFQKEQGCENSSDSGKKILNEISQLTNGQIPIYVSDCNYKPMPTVGDLRGKLWLIQAFPGNKNRVDLVGHLQVSTYSEKNILTDGDKYLIQNHWEGPENIKKDGIIKVLGCEKDLLKINFITQSNLPRFYAMRYNKWFSKMIEEKNLRNLGIVVIDFPDKKLINHIINSNFK